MHTETETRRGREGDNKNLTVKSWEARAECRDERVQHKQQRDNRQQRAERREKQ